MMNWHDNKRIAVMMAFDLDAETMWTTHGDGSTAHMTNLSRGAYGPKQGVPRILDMLDSHQVKATFFIPGVVAEHYPEVVREIARRGHDIGFHGYLHEESTKTTYEQEDATMHRSEKIIYDLTGQKIAGHRAPGGAKLILLDEPAAGMNPQESHELMEFIRLLKKQGYTVLMIEHDMSVVMNISDRIYVIDHGKPIAEGLPEEIAKNQKVIDVYLGGSNNAAKN